MKKRLYILLLTVLATLGVEARDVYLFSYFVGQSDGLHLAYSYDGLKWTALNGGRPLMTPTVGKDRLLRDPSIVEGPDGTFHMVWTSSWTDRIIGYASSRDLIHWSEQRALPVMEHEPEALNAWAPELFYDEPSRTYYICWATTIPGRHSPVASTEREKQWNHRIYCTTTRDFKTFTDTRLFFNPDFNAIDAAIVKDPKTRQLIMVVKNENSLPAEKNIRVTTTDDIRKGFPTKVSAPITPDKIWCEGPAPLFVGDTLYVYFDMYTSHRYGVVRSLDHGKTWQNLSDELQMPKGIRHGTAFRVSEQVLQPLLALHQTKAPLPACGPGSTVSILGDSYSTYEGFVSPASNELWYYAKSKPERTDVSDVRQTWWHQVISENGWRLCQNNSYSGATISYTGYDGNDYRDRSFNTRMTDLGCPDIIFIFGATNDSWAGSPLGDYKYEGITYGDLYQFRPALARMLDWMTARYINTRIYFILNSELRESINTSVKTICQHYGVEVIELKDIDKISGHPSVKGMRQIADQVNKAVKDKH